MGRFMDALTQFQLHAASSRTVREKRFGFKAACRVSVGFVTSLHAVRFPFSASKRTLHETSTLAAIELDPEGVSAKLFSRLAAPVVERFCFYGAGYR